MAGLGRRRYRRRMTPISFKRHRFSPEIIQHVVWLYARFTLSFRDVEDLLAERGIDVSNETVRRWFLKFGRLISCSLRRSRPRTIARWHLDEMVIRIRGRRHWLWRAVDDEGEVSRLPDPATTLRPISAEVAAEAAEKNRALRRSVLPRTNSNPTLLRSTKSDLPLFTIRDCGQTIEPRIHTSRVRRRERKQQRFNSPGSAQRFLSIHAAVYNAFYVQRHLLPRRIFKAFRAETFAVWNQGWCAA